MLKPEKREAQHHNPRRPQVAGSPLGQGRFDWRTCPHGCNRRRCAGDEPDCAFMRHHFSSDVPLEAPPLINPKAWPTDPTVDPGDGQNPREEATILYHQGGGDGFLAKTYDGVDASRFVQGGGVTTSGQPGTMMIWIAIIYSRSSTVGVRLETNVFSSLMMTRPYPGADTMIRVHSSGTPALRNPAK